MLPDDIIIRRATKPEIIKYYLGWYKFKHFLLSFRGRRKEKLLEKEALQRLVDAYLVQTGQRPAKRRRKEVMYSAKVTSRDRMGSTR